MLQWDKIKSVDVDMNSYIFKQNRIIQLKQQTIFLLT